MVSAGWLLELAAVLLAAGWLLWLRWLALARANRRRLPPPPILADPYGLAAAEFAHDLNLWDREGRPGA